MDKIFGIGNKMWSIYTEDECLERYVDTIKDVFHEDEDVEERYEISKHFFMTDPDGNVHKMYDITLIATQEEAEAITKILGLEPCNG